jgi:hypothetical protein
MRAVERRWGVLFSGTQGKTNNTTHFVHLQSILLWGFRHLLAVVSLYKPWTLEHMSSPQTCRSGLHTHFIIRLRLRLALSHALTQHSTSALLSEPVRHGITPQKGGYLGAFWELIGLPFCLLRQAWIWTWALTSLMSGATRLVPEPYQVPLCNQTHLLGWPGERLPPPDQHGPVAPCCPPGRPGMLRWWQGGENPTLQIPNDVPRNVAGGVRQRLRGHQSFWEASLLSRSAATQLTHIQKLSPENKGAFLSTI